MRNGAARCPPAKQILQTGGVGYCCGAGADRYERGYELLDAVPDGVERPMRLALGGDLLNQSIITVVAIGFGAASDEVAGAGLRYGGR